MYNRGPVIAAYMTIVLASSALGDKARLTGHDWKNLDHAVKQSLARQSVKLTRPSLNRQQTEIAAEGVMTCMNSELREDDSDRFVDQNLTNLLAYCLRIMR